MNTTQEASEMGYMEVELELPDQNRVTIAEVLEDFADETPGWQFLDDDSRYYAAVRGRESCIVRGDVAGVGVVDFAFTETAHPTRSSLHLTAIAPPDDAELLRGEVRLRCVGQFMEVFRGYALAHRVDAELRVLEYDHDSATHAEG